MSWFLFLENSISSVVYRFQALIKYKEGDNMENFPLLGFFSCEAAVTSKTACRSVNTVSSCLGNIHRNHPLKFGWRILKDHLCPTSLKCNPPAGN